MNTVLLVYLLSFATPNAGPMATVMGPMDARTCARLALDPTETATCVSGYAIPVAIGARGCKLDDVTFDDTYGTTAFYNCKE